MHNEMSQRTKREVMERLRRNYAKAGPEYKSELIDQAIELLGYHRKAAIRALNRKKPPVRAPAVALGRPREYEPERLLKVLKPIWFAAFQPVAHTLLYAFPLSRLS